MKCIAGSLSVRYRECDCHLAPTNSQFYSRTICSCFGTILSLPPTSMSPFSFFEVDLKVSIFHHLNIFVKKLVRREIVP